MPSLDVCVVGEINPDLILYGLPNEFEAEESRSLMDSVSRWEALLQFSPTIYPCSVRAWASSRRSGLMRWERWRSAGFRPVV